MDPHLSTYTNQISVSFLYWTNLREKSPDSRRVLWRVLTALLCNVFLYHIWHPYDILPKDITSGDMRTQSQAGEDILIQRQVRREEQAMRQESSHVRMGH